MKPHGQYQNTDKVLLLSALLLLDKGIFTLIQARKAEHEPDKILKCVLPKERENKRQVRKKRALFFFALPKKEIRKLRLLEKKQEIL